jgi:hypothetical protein
VNKEETTEEDQEERKARKRGRLGREEGQDERKARMRGRLKKRNGQEKSQFFVQEERGTYTTYRRVVEALRGKRSRTCSPCCHKIGPNFKLDCPARKLSLLGLGGFLIQGSNRIVTNNTSEGVKKTDGSRFRIKRKKMASINNSGVHTRVVCRAGYVRRCLLTEEKKTVSCGKKMLPLIYGVHPVNSRVTQPQIVSLK